VRLPNRWLFNVVLLVVPGAWLAIGCADHSWEAAQRTNTVASYHQFLRDNPESPFAAVAEERIDYLRVEALPSIQAATEFEAAHPSSEFLPAVRDLVEPLRFEIARSQNTAEAYQTFLRDHPAGRLAARARGNLAWVEGARDGSVPELREFIAAHPESDFASEAKRVLELLKLREATAFRKLGVRVDVAPDVEEGERVARGFVSLVTDAYRDAGVDVTAIAEGAVPDGLDGWLRIDYAEAPAPGTFGRGSLISDCRVRLYHRQGGDSVWDRRFQAPAEHLSGGARGRDRTVFGNARYAFWREFFVPTTTWATSQSRIHRTEYDEPVAAVDVAGERAAVLLRSGTVEYLDVASGLEPKTIQRYRRTRDLAVWTGMRLLPGDRAALFGPNGLELVDFSQATATRLGRWDIPEVGGVSAAALIGESLLLAGNRGLFVMRLGHEPLAPHRLLDGEWVGVAARGEDVWLVSPNQIAVASAKQLMRHVTGARTPFRSTFVARGSRLVGDSLWVFSSERAVQFALGSGSPRPVADFDAERFGSIADVTADGERLYLLGGRGLRVAPASGSSNAELVQVAADQSMVLKGRFLFLAGGQAFEVVDVSPYRAALASPEH
jgi:hypothetical protein